MGDRYPGNHRGFDANSSRQRHPYGGQRLDCYSDDGSYDRYELERYVPYPDSRHHFHGGSRSSSREFARGLEGYQRQEYQNHTDQDRFPHRGAARDMAHDFLPRPHMGNMPGEFPHGDPRPRHWSNPGAFGRAPGQVYDLPRSGYYEGSCDPGPDNYRAYPPTAGVLGPERPPPSGFYEWDTESRAEHGEVRGSRGGRQPRGRGGGRGSCAVGKGERRGRSCGVGRDESSGKRRNSAVGRGCLAEGIHDGKAVREGKGGKGGGARGGRTPGADRDASTGEGGDNKRQQQNFNNRKEGSSKAADSLKRSLSTQSNLSVNSSGTAASVGKTDTNRPSVKDGFRANSSNHELVQIKTSLTIKKHFEDVAQLVTVLEKHFKKEQSDAAMAILETSAILSEKESFCIVDVTAGSKQQAMRLIINMCHGIHQDLQVPCHFCISSWKSDTGNNSSRCFEKSVRGTGDNQQKMTTTLTDTQPSSTGPGCKKQKEIVKDKEKNQSSNQKSKSLNQPGSKIVITIEKGFDDKQQLVTFLQESAGALNSQLPQEPSFFSLLGGLTVCEYESLHGALAAELSKVLNQVPYVKAICLCNKPTKKQKKEETADIRSIIQEASSQINESVKKELAKHTSKLRQTEKSLSALEHVLPSQASGNEAERAQEASALLDKLREFDRQKKEFEQRIEKLKTKLDNLDHTSAAQKDVDAILRDVGIECKRLSAGLPIYSRRSELIEKVQSNQVSIILGETGSGKSTQMAQYLWEEGVAGEGRIVCTQPRKVAALTLAERVSSELVRNVGSLVGYKSGMRQKVNKETRILFYTDHSLLNECLEDPLLSKYTCIIIDEAHERSIYSDILLGMIKSFLPRRPDLKLVITSATINPDVFIKYFKTSPELRVSGRAFPVDIVYEEECDNATPFENYEKKAVAKAIEIHKSGKVGDILVFLTSAVEIMRCCEEIAKSLTGRTDFVCFPLHGQLPPEEQRKVFKPLDKGKRKIIFSTNCAETSITIDGIKFVVDTGVVNEMRYDPRKNMSSLGTQIISQSSADQRKGRAGRTSSGTCYRLYSEASYGSMVTTNQPEILRVHLGQAVLKLAELGVDVRKYDFVEAPQEEAIGSAISVLQELQALTLEDARITEVGTWLSKLPFDPRQSYVVYLGHEKELLYEAVTLATLISNGSNLIYRGLNEAEEQIAARTKSRFGPLNGDLFTWFEIYKTWVQLPKNEQMTWCKQNCVNYKVLSLTKQTISEVRQNLTKELKIGFEFKFSDDESSLELLRRMVFEANLPSLCHYSGHKRAGYLVARSGHQVHPHPSSNLALQNHYPQWIIYTHLVKTSRDFIRGITKVEEDWIESAVCSGKLPKDLYKVKDLKVQIALHKEVGHSVFGKLVGPQFSNLRHLEDTLAQAGMSSVVVEADRELGTFDVYSSTPMHPLEGKKIEDAIDETVCTLRCESEELPIGQDRAGVRVVLGEGACVESVFMPYESNRVRITLTDAATDKEVVKTKFSAFGEITECIKFKTGQSWGFVKYKTLNEANQAVNATFNDPELRASLMVTVSKPKKCDFEARLSWCRRPITGKGMAIIRCPPLDRVEINGMEVCIRGSTSVIKVSNRNEEDLVLFNTGLAEEHEIKTSILQNLNWNDEKQKKLQINVVRQQVNENAHTLKELENRLTHAFEKIMSTDKFSIRLLPPKKGSVNYVAFISFANAINGFQACQRLRRSDFFMQGQRVNISPDLKTKINIPKAVMKVCKSKFDSIKELVESEDIGVSVTFRQLPQGDYVADILTGDEESMVRMRAAIQKELEGDVIPCAHNNFLKGLLRKQGKDFLRKVEQEHEGVMIMTCLRSEKVSIFGSDRLVTLAKTQINDYLGKLSEGIHEEIFLRGQGRPVGLMKVLLKQYPDLREDFVKKFEIEDVFINYKTHTLSVVGSMKSIEKLKQAINNIEKNLQLIHGNEPTRAMPDCVTCMCPVDDSSDIYRLERCGHCFCLTCLRMQLGVHVDSKQFPLNCAEEACGEPWVWRDIQMCIRKGWISKARLVERAVDAFVIASGDSYKFCLSPNCSVVYKVTEVAEGVEFCCPSCQVSLCSSCHTAFHDGLTCRQASRSERDNLSLQEWMKHNASRCKSCPGCGIPVEKIEGCNKMHCKCGAYFCWLCLDKFLDEQRCYAHLAKVHGGFS
ncbi:hypothetical protein EGW08_007425 [Elysia chlorotica]|uniref:RNA helicase n=1 Tax=Elysia chlorotica TaxID=188477 RepID=A0A3S1BC83_ELYCH|nr:hypothetical protein EGW08_007425 [Elysia chlorotica]